MMFQCWVSVEDAGPTFKKHWVNVSYTLGHCRRHTSPGGIRGRCIYPPLEALYALTLWPLHHSSGFTTHPALTPRHQDSCLVNNHHHPWQPVTKLVTMEIRLHLHTDARDWTNAVLMLGKRWASLLETIHCTNIASQFSASTDEKYIYL